MNAVAAANSHEDESAEKLAHGVHEMAVAYTMIKNVELHEKFTIDGPKLHGEETFKHN